MQRRRGRLPHDARLRPRRGRRPPRTELLRSTGAEGVGRSYDDLLAVLDVEVRQLGDAGGLANAVDADYEENKRAVGHVEGTIGVFDAEHLDHLAFEDVEGLVGRGWALLTEAVDEFHGGLDAHVGGDENLLQFPPIGPSSRSESRKREATRPSRPRRVFTVARLVFSESVSRRRRNFSMGDSQLGGRGPRVGWSWSGVSRLLSEAFVQGDQDCHHHEDEQGDEEDEEDGERDE